MSDTPSTFDVASNDEDHLREILRAMGVGDWSYNTGSGRFTCSAAAANMLSLAGTSLDSLDALLCQFVQASGERLRQAFQRYPHDASSLDEEVQTLPINGASRWLRLVATGVTRSGTSSTQSALVLFGGVRDVTATKRAQEETLQLAMRLTTTLASMTEAFATVDRLGRFNYLNAESERLLQRSSKAVLGEPIWDHLHGRHDGLVRRHLEEAQQKHRQVDFIDFYPPLSAWIETRAYPFTEGLAVYFRDVTEQVRSQEQLRLLEAGISHLNDLVLIAEVSDGDHINAVVVFVNNAFERQTGFQREQIVGKTLRSVQMNRGNRRLIRDLLLLLAAGKAHGHSRQEVPVTRQDGSAVWMDVDVVAVRNGDSPVTHWIAVGRDVSERRRADQQIHDLAYYDPLTLLPNRRLLMERIDDALNRCARSGQEGALMFIDLDHFKVLNDTLGHAHGDQLLKQVADRLCSCMRESDVVARLGGDEFVVMLQGLGVDSDSALERARAVASKLLARVTEPFDIDGGHHYITTSIGVARFNADHGGLNEVMKQADLAMYQAKAMGRNAISFFDPAMERALRTRAELGADLRTALHDSTLLVHYQPQFDQHGRITGAEALLRWPLAHGQVGPDTFIPVAEETGLIGPLGLWVIEQVCEQLAAWARHPLTANLNIAINVSTRQFRHPDFAEQVIAAIRRWSVVPRLLQLEITESLLADRVETTRAKMLALKQLGVTFSLDDFGTGYSSLAYLKHLPLDVLKIDKAFVADVLSDPHDAAISSAIVGLAHSLQLRVVAEGVETPAQFECLTQLGCDLFQGYLMAPALPLEEFERLLAIAPTPGFRGQASTAV